MRKTTGLADNLIAEKDGERWRIIINGRFAIVVVTIALVVLYALSR